MHCLLFIFVIKKTNLHTHIYNFRNIPSSKLSLLATSSYFLWGGGDFGISWNVYVYFCTFTSGFVSSTQCCIEQDWLLPLGLGRLTAEVWSDMWYPRTKQVGHINLYIIFGILLDTYLACIAFLKVLLCYIYTYIHYT